MPEVRASIQDGEAVPDPTLIQKCEECGKPEGSFACKIRHLQVNTGFAKAYEDFK